MTEILIISLTAFATAILTLFSGFGLGTLLMPVVAIFFPLEVAVAITAVVHLTNNLFKIALLGHDAHRNTLIKFGLPAIIAALFGALLLSQLSSSEPVFSYIWQSMQFEVTTIKLIIGLLILGFVAIELSPRMAALQFDKKYLPLGGLISGFFGGLSGHQGAFRSMFLVKSGLNKQQYVATSAMLAVMVDIARLGVYATGFLIGIGASVDTGDLPQVDWATVVSACIAAFTGSYFGKKLLKKVTISWIQKLVSVLLVVIALGLIGGLI